MLTLPAYIDERYRLDSLIGVGGFCPVFLGRQLSVDRPVAVKMISADSQNPTWTKRFEREAVVLAQLKHNNTVKMFDYGVLQDSICYLVMEYVDGKTLREVLDEVGKLELARALTLICGVLESLEEAHSLGVIHRDLKPNNIMLTRDHMGREQVRVLDFGVAGLVPGTKVVKVDGAEITADGFIGTPRYAAPEQLTGLKLTPAADVYAIGLLLWELLVGAPAVPESKVEVCLRYHLGKKPWRVPADARLPSRIVAIIEAALRKEPSERTQSCTDMLAELRAVLSGPRGLDEESSEGLIHAHAQMTDPNVEGFGISEVSEASQLSQISSPGGPNTLDGVRPATFDGMRPSTIEGARPQTLRGLGNISLEPARSYAGGAASPSLELPAGWRAQDERRPDARGADHRTPPPAQAPDPLMHQRRRENTPPQLRSNGPRRPAQDTPAAEAPRRAWRFSPEMIVLGVVVAALLGALVWRQLAEPIARGAQGDPSKISPEVARLLAAPLPRGADTTVEAPERSAREVVFDALRADGWSVGRIKASNDLGSVQVSSYRVVREEAELTVELVQGVSAGVVEEFLREDAHSVKLGATGLKLRADSPAGRRALPELTRRLSQLGAQLGQRP